jgi:hypothetical protein
MKINYLIDLSIVIFFLNLQISFAQAPQKLNYQSVILDANNILLSSASIGIKISVIQGSVTGQTVYVETQNTNTNINGLVNLEIGTGLPIIGLFTAINWASGPYFIKIEIDPSGGNSYSVTGFTELLSVPYAMHSANALSGAYNHYKGEVYNGGIIFHLWKDAQNIEHGLIVDTLELSTAEYYSNIQTVLIGTTAQSSWNGLGNSNAIIGQVGHTNSAALLCLNSTNNGQSDWYLPAIDELFLLWHNRFIINKVLSTIPNASELPVNFYQYVSSTEIPNNNACYFSFEGYGVDYGKYAQFRVRAVRSF